LVPAVSIHGKGTSVRIIPTKFAAVPEQKDLKYQKIINQWLHYNQPNLEWDLLYKASLYGWNNKSFHMHCDHAGASAVIVRLMNGYTFGGFTSIAWDEYSRTSGREWDKRELIFSLEAPLRTETCLRPTEPDRNVPMNSQIYSPQFGIADLQINLELPNNSCSSSRLYKAPTGTLDVWLGGTHPASWQFDDVEVWGVRKEQKRIMEGYIALLTSPNEAVVTHTHKVLLKLEEMGARMFILKTLQVLPKRGFDKSKYDHIATHFNSKLKILNDYKIVSVNGYPLKELRDAMNLPSLLPVKTKPKQVNKVVEEKKRR